jgi:hypothetical protein
MVFAAELAAISGISASMLATERCRHACSVNAGSIPHDLIVLAEPTQDCLMHTLPNTCIHPFVKTTPTRHATAAAEFTRRIFPGYSSFEDKQDSRQGRPIIDAWPSTFWRPVVGWEMICNKRPEVFGKKCLGHGISPSGNTVAILRPDNGRVLPLSTPKQAS